MIMALKQILLHTYYLLLKYFLSYGTVSQPKALIPTRGLPHLFSSITVLLMERAFKLALQHQYQENH